MSTVVCRPEFGACVRTCMFMCVRLCVYVLLSRAEGVFVHDSVYAHEVGRMFVRIQLSKICIAINKLNKHAHTHTRRTHTRTYSRTHATHARMHAHMHAHTLHILLTKTNTNSLVVLCTFIVCSGIPLSTTYFFFSDLCIDHRFSTLCVKVITSRYAKITKPRVGESVDNSGEFYPL